LNSKSSASQEEYVDESEPTITVLGNKEVGSSQIEIKMVIKSLENNKVAGEEQISERSYCT